MILLTTGGILILLSLMLQVCETKAVVDNLI